MTDEQLAAVRVPTLAVVGTAAAHLDAVKELEAVVPGVRLVIVEGAEHKGEGGVLQRPESYQAVWAIVEANRIGPR